MINSKKLLQFYIEQYTREGKKKPKKPPKYSGMDKKVASLRRTIRNTKSSRINIRSLEELHRQVKNITAFAIRKNRSEVLLMIESELLDRKSVV